MKQRSKILSIGVAFFLFPATAMAQKKVSDTAQTKDIEGVVVTALGVKREQKASKKQ